MTTTLDQLAVRHPNVPSDRRPSLNTQAAIDAYDYRFAAWEVIDGADIREVCRRLDVPGGPTVLGPKVVALRARLEDCAKVGRPPPERPTTPPLSPLAKGAGAAAPLDVAWRERPRPGMALDATANPSAKKVTGRALVTRAADTQDDDQPQRPSTPAPWREALTLKVSAAAVRTVAEQEGSDPVKALRAAGFAQEAEALQAELRAAAATPPPSAQTSAVPTSTKAALVEVEDVLADAPASVYDVEGRWPRRVRTYTAIAGHGEDIPASAELAAEAAADETLWEQTHSEETVRAAQAEHARQRALLHDLSEHDREDEEIAAASDAAPPAPPAVLPVARGRSTKTLAASAATEVVKAPLRGRSAPPPVAPPAASAAPAQPLPLPKWPAKAPVVVSDPPPKRDRSKNRQVAPKPPEPAQPILLGMSPETTTPTSRRPHRRKVAAVPVPPVAMKAKQAPRKPKANIDKLMAGLVLTSDLRVEVRRALEMLTSSRVGIQGSRQYPLRSLAADEARWEARMRTKTSRDGKPWSESHESDVDLKLRAIRLARATAVDLDTRLDQIRLNRAMALQCPPFKHITEADWSRCITELIMGTTSYTLIARTYRVNHNDLGGHLRRHGVRRELFAELASRRGMRASQKRRSLDDTCPLALLFGRKLHQVRSQYALTQTEVAVALDLPPTIVTAMEQGRYAPCSVIVKRAATYFRMDWRDLLRADDEAGLVRMLVDGTERKQRAWTCADLLRKLVLPYLGVVVPEPTRRQVAATAKTKAKVNP